MKKLIPFVLLVSLTTGCFAQSTLQSPFSFLGYELGDRFTSHHRVVEYFKQVDQAMANVQVLQYGETYEHRPLIYAVLTSPENFSRLEQIRTDNLKRARILPGTPSGAKVAIVWLSYGVHGNESSSSEAAMKTLFDLVDPSQEHSRNYLRNTVVIIDPCINPDGRERYVNFYTSQGNIPLNADPQSAEHREPWPGGRTNHYLFDLNRDWAWETQTESRARLQLYNQWLPQVHVDFHEQSPSNPYYFAPAAEPLHREVTAWQKEFQETVGKNNAHYFDQHGWLYFTKERFDLYYPGYGDSYPLFSGAIGMTYEKGGGGSAGLKTVTPSGDTVTLKDRLIQHYTTSMSTVEVSSLHSGKLVEEFAKYFSDPGTQSVSPYKSYIIKADNNPDKINRLTGWLESHGIQFGRTGITKAVKGFDFQSRSSVNTTLASEDLVIPVDQPKGRLVSALFDPQPILSDSLTYDITSWNLIYGFNLKAYALNEKITAVKMAKGVTAIATIPTTPYAYLFKYKSLEDIQLMSSLLKSGVKVRAAKKMFTILGQKFDAGTLILTRRNNESVVGFDTLVQGIARRFSRPVVATTTGWVEKGADFGSTNVDYIARPKIALLAGEQTYSGNCGEVWHFFEQQIHFPISLIRTEQFRSTDLSKYTVLIVPEGSYQIFDEAMLEVVSKWVADGGRLILIGEALNSFADKKGFGLKVYATEQKKKESEEKDKEDKVKEGVLHYGDAERKQLSQFITGAIFKVSLDQTHPLAFGLGESYYTLKTNRLHFEYLTDGWNTGILQGNVTPVIGFAGYKISKKLTNTLSFGVENKGRGQVVYLVDNPLFREFWEDGKILFSNAVFLSGL